MQKAKIEKILNRYEIAVIRKLSTPIKIQDYLDKIPFNFELNGETYYSPRKVLRENLSHCFEGALFAALCLQYHGIKNYLMDLKVLYSAKSDSDHTLCLYKTGKFLGAISKTNHSVLRWRDPIFISPRELAMSYFHEYFLDNGKKTLSSYSLPFDVWKKFGYQWIFSNEDLDEIALSIDKSRHLDFVPKTMLKLIRNAGKTEIKGAAVEEWNKNGQMI